jgi:phosphatidate cytidylyltransferase
MLIKRLVSSAIIISLLLVMVVIDFWVGKEQWLDRSGVVLVPLILVLIGLAAKELISFFAGIPVRLDPRVIVPATVLTTLFACVPMLWRDYPIDCAIGKSGWALFGLAAAVGLIFICEMFRFRIPGESIQRMSLGIFTVGYLGLLSTFLPALRMFHSNAWGMAALLSVIIITKVSDSGAYATGRMIGRHKMSPILSPKKTWEGAAGAFVTGALASIAIFLWLVPWLTGQPNTTPIWAMIVYAIVVTIAGMIGDLAESLIKRDAQQKDSSKWLPGLGGMLDIIDSLLVAAPAAFACWVSGLIGPLSAAV